MTTQKGKVSKPARKTRATVTVACTAAPGTKSGAIKKAYEEAILRGMASLRGTPGAPVGDVDQKVTAAARGLEVGAVRVAVAAAKPAAARRAAATATAK